MNEPIKAKPSVRPSGLTTLAYLKARIDEGKDQLEIYFPLVLDVLKPFSTKSFTSSDIQRTLNDVHGVSMPEATIATLLKRAGRKGYVIREAGRYSLNPDKPVPVSNTSGEKEVFKESQDRLAGALLKHAIARGVDLGSTESALALLLKFIDEEQVSMLLGAPIDGGHLENLSRKESLVIAEFLYDVARQDTALKNVLNAILEGLVVYHAAFLPDWNSAESKFRKLTVFLDSILVMQGLGYEGDTAQKYTRNIIDLLRASNVRCCVFDVSVEEIDRILALYQRKLATPEGRKSLRPVPIARHFLTCRYSPSDVQEMSALLQQEIRSLGLTVVTVPRRTQEFTYKEESLSERLARPDTQDLHEPRIRHDVDCVAGVLTLRKGKRTTSIEEARAVFATSASLVIQNTRLWWQEDEDEAGVPPIIHIRALANLAWLKRPSLRKDLQLSELVALCGTAMRPSQGTWQKFLSHLQRVNENDELSEDHISAVVSSAISDRILSDVEIENEDDEIDSDTLNEAVGRVMAEYEDLADKKVDDVTKMYEERISETEQRANQRAAKAERVAAELQEQARRRSLKIDGRASLWASRICSFLFYGLCAIAVFATVAILIYFPVALSLPGLIVLFAVAVLALLELIGVLSHLQTYRHLLEGLLRNRLRGWWGGDELH